MDKAMEMANAICANARIAVQESSGASVWACRRTSLRAPPLKQRPLASAAAPRTRTRAWGVSRKENGETLQGR